MPSEENYNIKYKLFASNLKNKKNLKLKTYNKVTKTNGSQSNNTIINRFEIRPLLVMFKHCRSCCNYK